MVRLGAGAAGAGGARAAEHVEEESPLEPGGATTLSLPMEESPAGERVRNINCVIYTGIHFHKMTKSFLFNSHS